MDKIVTDHNKKIISPFLLFLSVLLFLVFLGPLLFTHTRMFAHDTIWFYGVFHYFGECIFNGAFPYWDVYDYSGQVFYPNLSILQLTNPITILVILIGKVLHMSLLNLYHWNFVILVLFCGQGVYCLSKKIHEDRLSSLMVFVVFLFSSFTLSSLRQVGILYALLWLPWVLYFMLRTVDKVNFLNVVGLALFMGLANTGYQGLLVMVYAFIFFILLIARKKEFRKKLYAKNNLVYLAVFTVIVAVLSGPLLSVFADKDDFVPMARMRTSIEKTDSFTNKTGSVPSKVNDFLGLINRDIAVSGYFKKKIALSEGFLHIGYIPFILALIGVFFSKNSLKGIFMVMGVFLFLIMLGDRSFVQGAVNFIFPPFKFVRHMQLFSGFFILNLIMLMGMGLDRCVSLLKTTKPGKYALILLLILIVFDVTSYAGQAFSYCTLEKSNLDFNVYAEGMEFSKVRNNRIATNSPIRYFKPILHREHTAFNSASIPKDLSSEYMRTNIFEVLHFFDKTSDNDDILAVNGKTKSVNDFLDYGFSDFSKFSSYQRDIFLDVLNVITFDILSNQDFYSGFDGLLSGALAARKILHKEYTGIPDVAVKKMMPFLKVYFKRFISLNFKPGNMKESFLFLGKQYSLKSRVYLHSLLYGSKPLREYLEYIWLNNHVEEFTLLLDKDYRDVIALAGKDPDETFANSNLNDILGLSEEGTILRFYDSAKISTGNEVLKSIVNEDMSDTLYIESKGDAKYRGQTLKKGPDNFKYNVIDYGPNNLEIEYISNKSGFIYYSDTYNKYWKAYLNDEVIPVLKAQDAFKAVKVPAGRNRIEFKYRPALFRSALILYYLLIAGCVLFVLLYGRSSKRG